MAMPTPASQPQAVRVGSQWTYISSLNWGVECDEDGGWQFKWGKKTEQRLESYLHYDDEQTLQHRTECRTYYDSVVYRNDTTGETWDLKAPSNGRSRAATKTYLYFELDGIDQCIGGLRGLYEDAAGERAVL